MSALSTVFMILKLRTIIRRFCTVTIQIVENEEQFQVAKAQKRSEPIAGKLQTCLRATGSKFWLKISYDSGGSAEKNSKNNGVYGVSWKVSSGYLRFGIGYRNFVTKFRR